MDTLMLILFGIILVLCIIFYIYSTLYNKLQSYIIIINEVESKIDNNLRNKYDNINKCVSLIRGNEKLIKQIDNKIFDEIIRLRTQKISNFDLDRKLEKTSNEFITLKEKYEILKDNPDILELEKKNEDVNELLEINKTYYNNCISEYNKLVTLFPTNIVANICKFKEKLYFDGKDMSDDDVNDFKF